MLRKLMKHELRATGRVMGPALLFMLIAAAGGNVAVHNLVDSQSAMLKTIGVVLLMIFAAAFVGTSIVSLVLMIRRFYQNLLRDEGYLMMTLPVTVHEHVLSKLFVSIIWMAATIAAMFASMAILVFELEFVGLIFHDIGELFAQIEFSGVRLADYAGHAVLLVLEMILLLIAAAAYVYLQFYAAMAAGHSFTHHKGLLSVAAWFVFSIAWNILQNGAIRLFGRITPETIRFGLEVSPAAATHITMLALIASCMLCAAIWYAVTTYFLKNRLNLG